MKFTKPLPKNSLIAWILKYICHYHVSLYPYQYYPFQYLYFFIEILSSKVVTCLFQDNMHTVWIIGILDHHTSKQNNFILWYNWEVPKYTVIPLQECSVQMEYIIIYPNQSVVNKIALHLLTIQEENILRHFNYLIHRPK